MYSYLCSVRGGTGLLPYPDALTSVVHGCAELDKETDAKQVQQVKSSGVAAKKVVKTVYERVDNVMFEKLNDKLFHHHDQEDDHDHKGKEAAKPQAKISFGLREFLLEDDMFE